MNLPSVKAIAKAFNLPVANANRIRVALEAARDCLWYGSGIGGAMQTISKQIDGMGVSYVRPRNDTFRVDLTYVDKEDPYSTTVCFDHRSGRFFIGSWGDWVERNDPHGTKY